MAFQMNAKNPMPVRVDLLGRFQGILSITFHGPDDFIVAEAPDVGNQMSLNDSINSMLKLSHGRSCPANYIAGGSRFYRA